MCPALEAEPPNAGQSDDDEHDCGVAFVALGTRSLDQAQLSAARIRRFAPATRIVLFSDRPDAVHASHFSAVFAVADVPQTTDGLVRIDAMRQFPFQRTLFLDTEAEVVADFTDVFTLLARFDVAAAPAPNRSSRDQPSIPPSFPEYACGVVGISKSIASQHLLDRWRDEYLRRPDGQHQAQSSFRAALWTSNAQLATLPPAYNLRPKARDGGDALRVLHGFDRRVPADDADRRLRFLSTDHGCHHHRSGWDYALRALTPLTHPRGVLLDTMVDNSFAWHATRYAGIVPFTEPWVGIAHIPPAMPDDDRTIADPRGYTRSAPFIDSMPACRGLFALSAYQAASLSHLGVPVEVLRHPVDLDVPRFRFDSYRSHQRRVVHVGWWLRRFETFARLKAASHAKIALTLPGEQARRQIAGVPWTDVDVRPYAPPAEYDALLASSLVFVDLIDASANNVVLDCIARATPIIVNDHPAVREYLGNGYPLLYSCPEEAEAFFLQDDLLFAAHLYLSDDAFRARFSGDAFRAQLRGSAIYERLPAC